MFGRMLNETLGKVHFWLTAVTFNLVFFPMFVLGMGGHMRRIYNPMQYEFLQSLAPINQLVTVAAVALLLAQIPFIVNFVGSLWFGAKAPQNPWHANTLEWTTASPPPHGNFATVPTVYRGPYEYSAPGVTEDFLPQTQPLAPGAAAARA
jgi:cytochrome c oxidase subunit 1